MFYRLNMPIDILEFIPYYMYKEEALPLETVASVISYSNQQPYLWLGGCFFDACVFTRCQISTTRTIVLTDVTTIPTALMIISIDILCMYPFRQIFHPNHPPEEASNYSAKGAVTALLVF